MSCDEKSHDSDLLIDLVDNTQHPQRSLPMPSVASCHVLVVVVVVPLPFLSSVFTQTWCPFSLPSHPVFLFLSRSFSPSAVFFFFFLVLVFFLLSSPDALFPSPFFPSASKFLEIDLLHFLSCPRASLESFHSSHPSRRSSRDNGGKIVNICRPWRHLCDQVKIK